MAATRSVLVLLSLVTADLSTSSALSDYQPQQIHLSYGRDETQMILTWSTRNNTDSSLIRYGRSMERMNQEVNGTRTYFNDGGPHQLTQYFHRAVMIGLTPGETYYYICGSMKYGWSDLYKFKAMPKGDNWSPRLVMFGDMGSVNAQSLPRLQKEMHMYDAVFHIGDFAYDMDSNESTVGDNFMNQIQSIAAHLPYMTCPGNHEWAKNFTNYKNRFTMPGDVNGNMFYSFDMGPAHIISVNTEYYYYTKDFFIGLFQQLEWFENDLKKANLPENRAKRPWIIVMGHRPMYCSNDDKDDCTKYETLTRVGIPFLHLFGLEDKFDKYGVDLALWAHEHSYERLWPVYNRKVMNGSYEAPYTNPRAPVHIITGSAGCRENHDGFLKPRPWTAIQNKDYGYTRMTIHNHTHISFQQVSDDKNGQIIDSFTLIKDKHEPYGLGDK